MDARSKLMISRHFWTEWSAQKAKKTSGCLPFASL